MSPPPGASPGAGEGKHRESRSLSAPYQAALLVPKPEKCRVVFLSADLIVVFLVIGDFSAEWHSSVDFFLFLKGSQSDTLSRRGLVFSL